MITITKSSIHVRYHCLQPILKNLNLTTVMRSTLAPWKLDIEGQLRGLQGGWRKVWREYKGEQRL